MTLCKLRGNFAKYRGFCRQKSVLLTNKTSTKQLKTRTGPVATSLAKLFVFFSGCYETIWFFQVL